MAFRSSAKLPLIEVQPMKQRSEARSEKEDWTGQSDGKLRRKLQNRLNQRSSRRRRGIGSTPLQSPASDGAMYMEHEAIASMSLKLASPSTKAVVVHKIQPPVGGFSVRSYTTRTAIDFCNQSNARHILVSAPDFATYISMPLPVDQRLLTLMHFNLVRAMTQNIHVLGLDPDQMYLDIPSPFISSSGPAALQPSYLPTLPPALWPTYSQLTVPHHPEIDILPFPVMRDNLIALGDAIDDQELCFDMLYGVDRDAEANISSNASICQARANGGRTGLIVWSDPCLQSSWEVEEDFARKWRKLFVGCDKFLESTNFWRAKRGETKLILDV